MNFLEPMRQDGASASTEESCPRCDTPLEVTVATPDSRQVECPSCDYFRDEGDIKTRSGKVRHWIKRQILELTWPWTPVGSALVYYLSVLALCGSLAARFTPYLPTTTADPLALFGELLMAGFLLWTRVESPRLFCPECGGHISEPPEYCCNCGELVKEPAANVADPQTRVTLSGMVTDALPWTVDRATYNGGFRLVLSPLPGRQAAAAVVSRCPKVTGALLRAGAFFALAVWISYLLAVAVFAAMFASGWRPSVAPTVVGAVSWTPSLPYLIVLSVPASAMAILIHEFAHTTAFKYHGHSVEDAEMSLLLGIFPVGGLVHPDVSPGADAGLLEAVDVLGAGALANALVVVALSPLVAGLMFFTPGAVSTWSPVHHLLLSLAVWNALSILNLLPFPGSDGYKIQTLVLLWAAERAPLQTPTPVLANASYGVSVIFAVASVVLLVL